MTTVYYGTKRFKSIALSGLLYEIKCINELQFIIS